MCVWRFLPFPHLKAACGLFAEPTTRDGKRETCLGRSATWTTRAAFGSSTLPALNGSTSLKTFECRKGRKEGASSCLHCMLAWGSRLVLVDVYFEVWYCACSTCWSGLAVACRPCTLLASKVLSGAKYSSYPHLNGSTQTGQLQYVILYFIPLCCYYFFIKSCFYLYTTCLNTVVVLFAFLNKGKKDKSLNVCV